jgi:hypothetical protein
MFITKKHLSRRHVLRGFGTGLALPLLDAMIPASTALAQTAAAPQPRMAFVYFPHGAVMDHWTPATTGSDFVLPQILAPLAPFQKFLTVISGLENKPAIGEPVHAITPGTWLSCVHPEVSQQANGGVTIDQMIAQKISQDTPLPSLEIATEEEGGEGACDRNYGCTYGKTLSFSTPDGILGNVQNTGKLTPLPMEHNPRKLFQRLFGQGDTPAERDLLGLENASLLDMVTGEAADLRKTLGARDKILLDDYLTSVREIERRIQRMKESDLSTMSLPPTPAGIPDAFDEHMRVMFDITHLAFQANLTRVATYMMAAEVSNQPYNFIGVSDAFHPLSHHQNNAQKLQRLAQVQTFNTQIFAEFVQKLADTSEGENTMLENITMLFGSNMSDSNQHNNYPLPTTIVGGGMGLLKGNNHIKVEDRMPLANVHLTLLNTMGIDTGSLGDSNGMVPEILA